MSQSNRAFSLLTWVNLHTELQNHVRKINKAITIRDTNLLINLFMKLGEYLEAQSMEAVPSQTFVSYIQAIPDLRLQASELEDLQMTLNAIKQFYINDADDKDNKHFKESNVNRATLFYTGLMRHQVLDKPVPDLRIQAVEARMMVIEHPNLIVNKLKSYIQKINISIGQFLNTSSQENLKNIVLDLIAYGCYLEKAFATYHGLTINEDLNNFINDFKKIPNLLLPKEALAELIKIYNFITYYMREIIDEYSTLTTTVCLQSLYLGVNAYIHLMHNDAQVSMAQNYLSSHDSEDQIQKRDTRLKLIIDTIIFNETHKLILLADSKINLNNYKNNAISNVLNYAISLLKKDSHSKVRVHLQYPSLTSQCLSRIISNTTAADKEFNNQIYLIQKDYDLISKSCKNYFKDNKNINQSLKQDWLECWAKMDEENPSLLEKIILYRADMRAAKYIISDEVYQGLVSLVLQLVSLNEIAGDKNKTTIFKITSKMIELLSIKPPLTNAAVYNQMYYQIFNGVKEINENGKFKNAMKNILDSIDRNNLNVIVKDKLQDNLDKYLVDKGSLLTVKQFTLLRNIIFILQKVQKLRSIPQIEVLLSEHYNKPIDNMDDEIFNLINTLNKAISMRATVLQDTIRVVQEITKYQSELFDLIVDLKDESLHSPSVSSKNEAKELSPRDQIKRDISVLFQNYVFAHKYIDLESLRKIQKLPSLKDVYKQTAAKLEEFGLRIPRQILIDKYEKPGLLKSPKQTPTELLKADIHQLVDRYEHLSEATLHLNIASPAASGLFTPLSTPVSVASPQSESSLSSVSTPDSLSPHLDNKHSNPERASAKSKKT